MVISLVLGLLPIQNVASFFFVKLFTTVFVRNVTSLLFETNISGVLTSLITHIELLLST